MAFLDVVLKFSMLSSYQQVHLLREIQCLFSCLSNAFLPVLLILIKQVVQFTIVDVQALQVVVSFMIQHTVMSPILFTINVSSNLEPDDLKLL